MISGLLIYILITFACIFTSICIIILLSMILDWLIDKNHPVLLLTFVLFIISSIIGTALYFGH